MYQARHLMLDKFVAVKIMHADLIFDEKIVQRFQREVTAMSHLSHPNLISIQDVGKTPDGSPYFVMEYMDCVHLGDLLAREVFLPAERAIPIILQIADALAHAHEKGIVHRDLKPANILILESENRDFVKVVDLGIAKLLGPSEEDGQKLTRTGEAFGSPLYMSPEQVMGKPQDGRTDIYALGCLMFEMLTSVPPMLRESALGIMTAHVQEAPPSFSQAMPELPMTPELRRLEAIVLKCMKKDPQERFQTMRDLIQAIGADIPMDSGKFALTRNSSGQFPQDPGQQDPLNAVSAAYGYPPQAQAPPSNTQRGVPPALESCQSQKAAPNFSMTGKASTTDAAATQLSSSHTANPAPAPQSPELDRTRPVAGARMNRGDFRKTPPLQPEASSPGILSSPLKLAGIVGCCLLLIGILFFVAFKLLTAGSNDAAVSEPKKVYKLSEVICEERKHDRFNVRVLSVYSADSDDAGTYKEASGGLVKGTVDVAVHQEGKPIILVVNAYMPTTWKIHKLNERVRLEKVISVGYYPQKVEGLPPDVEREEIYYPYFNEDGSKSDTAVHKNAFEPFFFMFLGDEDIEQQPSFAKMKKALAKATHCELRSFQGTRSTKSFVVK